MNWLQNCMINMEVISLKIYLQIFSRTAEYYRRGENMAYKSSFEQIYDIVKQIPFGRVATYGQIAALAGNRRWSRVVGYALHKNPDPDHIPCYRVVNRFGEVSEAFVFGGANRQIALLEQEGIEVKEGRVDLKKYQWNRVTIDMME